MLEFFDVSVDILGEVVSEAVEVVQKDAQRGFILYPILILILYFYRFKLFLMKVYK